MRFSKLSKYPILQISHYKYISDIAILLILFSVQVKIFSIFILVRHHYDEVTICAQPFGGKLFSVNQYS